MIDRPASEVESIWQDFPPQSFCLSGLFFNSWEKTNTSLSVVLLRPVSFLPSMYLPQGPHSLSF